MKKGTGRIFVSAAGLLVWALCLGLFFVFFAAGDPGLPGRTNRGAMAALSFTVVYSLMCRVYGGFGIGRQKSRTIAFSMALVLLFSDLAAHLFLCLMDAALYHGGRFVYERPLRLLGVFLSQTVLTAGLAWVGNRLYFLAAEPRSCVMIVKEGGRHQDWDRKVALFRKQYRVRKLVFTGDPDVFGQLDGADAVFLYDLTEEERAPFAEYCFRQGKELYYSLDLAEAMVSGGRPVFFDDTAMVHTAAGRMTPAETFWKRTADILLSCLGLIVTSPLLLCTALAVRLSDGGPVLYRQKRVTRDGRVFDIIKFRSMRPETGADHRPVVENDDRITGVGRALRRFRVDELPQLWNVLRGDMSLVGPRPEMVENVERYTRELPQFAYRQRVKAGLTGLAQVYGRYNTTARDKLILDLLYIERFSLWLDIRILLRTALVLLAPDRSTEPFAGEETSAGIANRDEG